MEQCEYKRNSDLTALNAKLAKKIICGRENVTFSNGWGSLIHNADLSSSNYFITCTLNVENVTVPFAGTKNKGMHSVDIAFAATNAAMLNGLHAIDYLIVTI